MVSQAAVVALVAVEQVEVGEIVWIIGRYTALETQISYQDYQTKMRAASDGKEK